MLSRWVDPGDVVPFDPTNPDQADLPNEVFLEPTKDDVTPLPPPQPPAPWPLPPDNDAPTTSVTDWPDGPAGALPEDRIPHSTGGDHRPKPELVPPEVARAKAAPEEPKEAD